MKLSPVRRLLTALCLATASAAAVSVAIPTATTAQARSSVAPAAGDKITLKAKDGGKEGEVLEGRITKEVEGWIWFTRVQGGVETEVVLNPKDIEKIERGDSTPADAKSKPDAKPEGKTDGKGDAKPRAVTGVPRAAVITLEGEVGIQFAAKPLEEAMKDLDEEGVSVVVLKINSGGGLLLEVDKLSDAIHLKYKQKYRTVAWIESAISAAAMSAHSLEEIYFLPKGNYGACTGWSGALNAMKGRGLEQLLLTAEKYSARGGHDKRIMRAMQISAEESDLQNLGISPPGGQLSADIDPKTGEVTWYQGLEGQYTLNPKGGVRILTFNAEEAAKFKFSRGTAANIQELGKLMGYQELEWVGKEKKGVPYPVSKAEEHMLKWRKDITEAEENFAVYTRDYQRSVQTAQSTANRDDRGMWIGKSKTALAFLENIVKKHPNIGLLNGLDKDWFDQQREMLRKLAK